MNPYIIIAALVWSGLLIGGSYGVGVKHERNASEARQKEAIERQMKEHQANEAIDMQAAYEVGKAQQGVRTVIRTIQRQVDKVVEKPVYRDCALDPDGMRIWNAANRGEAVSPGQPDPVLPTVTGTKLPLIR